MESMLTVILISQSVIFFCLPPTMLSLPTLIDAYVRFPLSDVCFHPCCPAGQKAHCVEI